MVKKGKIHKSYRINLKRILLGVLFFFTLFIATIAIAGIFYSQKIKDYVVSGINKQLNTELQVENIELSVFAKFPYASVVFKNITAKDATKKKLKGNLLEAESLYLQFKIWDLFSGNYKIRRIELTNANAKLKIYEDGSDNFHFWKSSEGSGEEDFSLYLQRIIFNNVNVIYKDYRTGQIYSVKAKDVYLNGRFADSEFSLIARGDVFVNHIISGGIIYLNNKNVYTNLDLHVNNDSGLYQFREGFIKIGDMNFSISGDWINNSEEQSLDLEIKGKDIKLDAFLKELPPEYRSYIIDYEGRGTLDAWCSIKGSIKGDATPLVYIKAALENGRLEQKSTAVALEKVSLIAEFTNGKNRNKESSVLTIKNMSCSLKSGSIKGDLSLSDFNRPDINLNMTAILDLIDIKEFLKLDTINEMKGSVNINLKFHGQPAKAGTFTATDYINSEVDGSIAISKCNLAFKNSLQKYHNVNGSFNFNNNDVEIAILTGDIVVDSRAGKASVNDFILKGHFSNVLPYLFIPGQNLKIDADFMSGNMEIDKLLLTSMPANKTKEAEYSFRLPENLSFNINLDIKNLSFNKFNAAGVTGRLSLIDKQITAKNIRLNTMDGKVLASGIIDAGNQSAILLSCDATLEKVNIKKLFYQFGNFGQESMKEENLKGVLTADIQFAAFCDEALNIDVNSIYVKSSINVENGELINYKPVEGLSAYIKGRDLSNIKFASLTNQIEIHKRNIFIPSMEVKSSALNLKVWGNHNFDNEIEYHINISLFDLIGSPEKNRKKEDFGPIEDDGLHQGNYFFLITGNVDNPIYKKIDKQAYKEKIVGDIKKEKENLRNILKQEFGRVRKDSATDKDVKLKHPEKEEFKKKEGSGFIFEWEED